MSATALSQTPQIVTARKSMPAAANAQRGTNFQFLAALRQPAKETEPRALAEASADFRGASVKIHCLALPVARAN